MPKWIVRGVLVDIALIVAGILYVVISGIQGDRPMCAADFFTSSIPCSTNDREVDSPRSSRGLKTGAIRPARMARANID